MGTGMQKPKNSLQSPLGRIRGLGSAKDGTMHWWAQRVTALALIFLGAWFVFAVLVITGLDLPGIKIFLAQPAQAILFTLFLLTALHHGALGLQVVIEDYIHAKPYKFSALLLLQFITYGAMAVAIYAMAKINFGV
jgi:succinate dehydrogenase / fumarate reductase, membrane anchor subunit